MIAKAQIACFVAAELRRQAADNKPAQAKMIVLLRTTISAKFIAVPLL
jgi:hypothetical protein